MLRRIFIGLLIIVAALAAGWLALRREDIPYESLEAKYANENSSFLTLENGLIVHYRDEGPRDAPVIVLVHGFSSSLHTWEQWSKGLTDEYRVIRLDLPGHGLTRVSDDVALTTAGLANFVGRVSDAIGIEEFTLVGSSMGGHTAWTYALEHGDRLNALVLVDASGLPPQGENKDLPFVFKVIGNPVIGPLLVDLDLTPLIRGGVEKSFVDATLVNEEMIDRYAELSRAPGHRKALLALATRKSPKAKAQAERLKTLSVPTLIMFGDKDIVVPAADGARFAALIPGSKLIMYENVGHLPQEEVPTKSLEDLRAFLSEVNAGK
jgi:pimeloyl-ACP methyl ester carboxylesterase